MEENTKTEDQKEQEKPPEAPAKDPLDDLPESEREWVRRNLSVLEGMSPRDRAAVVELASAEYERRKNAGQPAEEKPKAAEKPASEKPAADADPAAALRQELKELREKLETREQREAAAENQRKFKEALEAELDKHELLREDKDARDLVAKAAQVEFMQSRDLSKAVRVTGESVAGIVKRNRQRYVEDKIEDEKSTRGESGGGRSVSKETWVPKSGDLKSGAIAERIKREMGIPT